MVFLTNQDLGTRVDKKEVRKDTGTQVSSGTRVVYSWQCVLIFCYTMKLRQKRKLGKKHQNQSHNNSN